MLAILLLPQTQKVEAALSRVGREEIPENKPAHSSIKARQPKRLCNQSVSSPAKAFISQSSARGCAGFPHESLYHREGVSGSGIHFPPGQRPPDAHMPQYSEQSQPEGSDSPGEAEKACLLYINAPFMPGTATLRLPRALCA